ncbi:tape measure protein [Enterococcus hirae]|nr:tape measure protein [Enterococcus hirae]
MENYSIQAVLSAVDKNFTSSMKGATGWLDRIQQKSSSSSGSILGFGAAFGVASSAAQSALSSVTNAVSGLIGDLNTGSATWKTFETNMSNIGKGKDEIKSVKKELQDFATQTIYSASDMATTYSQLEAVGIKSANKLVKGFGGLAAAAENPTQAMKTLSQQATQMAAKPTVQWMDFKLMLEQTPAGIAAVAKTMGKSTAQLVKDVQDGTVATQEFFDAVTATGTNENFTKMATEYKTVGQALDGLQETLVTKLQPAFDQFSQKGIAGIEKLIGWVDQLDIEKFLGQLNSGKAILEKFAPLLATLGAATGLSAALPILSKFNSGFSAISSKGRQVISAFGEIGAKGAELGKKVNLTNFAKGFETAREKLGGFKIGFLDLGEVFGNLDQNFLKVGSGVLSLQEKFPKLTAAMGSAGKIGSGIGTGLQKSTQVGMQAMSGMVSGLTSVMSVALSALGPAAILGVVLAGIGLLNSQFGEQIQQMITTVTTKGPEVINKLVSSMVAQLPTLMAAGTQILTGIIGAITANIQPVLTGAVTLIQTLVQGVIAALPQLIPAALSLVEQLALGIIDAAPKLLLTGLDLLLALVNGILANADQIISVATNIIETLTNNISANLPQIIDKGIEILVTLAQAIVKVLPKLIPVAFKAITTLVTSLAQKLPDIIRAAVEIISVLADGLIDNLPQIISAGVEMILAITNGIAKNIPEILAAGFLIITKLASALLRAVPQLYSAGQDLLRGFIRGIGDMIGDVVDKAREMASKAVSAVKEFLHIGSPSKLFRKFGKWTGEGFVLGMDSMIRDVEKKSDGLAAAALPDMGTVDYDLNQSLGSAKVALGTDKSAMYSDLETKKQSAVFNVHIGNQIFSGFVEDISELQGKKTDIYMQI